MKIPGFGLSGAEPGLTLESDGAARGRREPLVLAVRRLLTADTVRCKRPSFQPFPSGKGRETSLRDIAAYLGATVGEIAGCPGVRPAVGPGRVPAPRWEGGQPAERRPGRQHRFSRPLLGLQFVLIKQDTKILNAVKECVFASGIPAVFSW